MIGALRRQPRRLAMRAYGRRFRGPRGLVLMYHRITAASSDPWNMAVHPDSFAGQMEVLARTGLVCSQAELVGRLRAAEPLRGISVTFDDGYVDNLRNALPALERFGVPATFYITSGAIGVPAAFWWDRLQRIFLETRDLPQRLDLGAQSWDLGSEARVGDRMLARNRRWRADHERPRGARQRIFLEVWDHFAQMHVDARPEALARLDDWAASRAPADERPMTEAELRRFAASPQVEIGGHTRNHVDLSRTASAQGAREIAEDRAALQALTGQSVTSFALPFGRRGPDTAGHIRAAGYTNATTSRFGLCHPASDPWDLPRLQVEDMPVRAFEKLILSLTGASAGTEART